MKDKIKAMIKANFAADSLALGVHWIYDTEQIKQTHGEVTQLLSPAPGSYHATKKKGDFTHYGDQTLVLLESVAASGGFNLNDFFMRWQSFFESYDGYHDMATKITLKNIKNGKGPEICGSLSEDISPASRIAPLFLYHAHDSEILLEAARTQTEMTHRGSTAVEATQFFARLTLACIHGKAPTSAAITIAEEHFEQSPIHMWVQQGIAARDQSPVEVIGRFGQACSTSEVFPGIIQLISKYENNLSEALVQAVMAGGENAARSRITAMILAAYQGLDNRTEKWYQGLQKMEIIDGFLETNQ